MKWVITSFNVYYIWKVFFSWNIIFTRNKMTTKHGYSDLGIWWTFSFLNKKSVISKKRRKTGREGNMPYQMQELEQSKQNWEFWKICMCYHAWRLPITQTCLMRSVMTLTRVQDICNSVSQHFPHDLCLMLQNHVRVKDHSKYKTHQWILK